MQNLPEEAYAGYRSAGWSRIEMLTDLYVAALDATKLALDAVSDNQPSEATHRLRAMALVNTIESGLDLTQGELPLRIQQLCHYVQQSLLSGKAEQLASAIHVLQQLSDGFDGVRQEAQQLEELGQLPPLPLSSYDELA